MRRIALCCLWLSLGCVATTGPGLRLDDPSPPAAAPDVDRARMSIEGAGGLPLFVQRWRPRDAPPRAVVVIHHGLADHSDRYADFATRLVRAGHAVWALDMRGHARSGGARVVGQRMDHYLDDLSALLATVRATEGETPVYLLGHSLGGLISTLFVIERGAGVAGLIVSAPGLAFDEPPLQPAVIRVAAALAPGAPLLASPHEDFSSSEAVIAEMGRDPLIHQKNGPVITAASAVDGVRRVWAGVDRLRVPVLALHGTIDKLTAPSGSRDLVARVGTRDATLRLYEGANHDLLHEPDGVGDQVATDVLTWLEAHTAGGPALRSSPAGELKGDRTPESLSLGLDARADLTTEDDADRAVTAGLRLRVSRWRVTPLGLGWRGGLDVRAGHDGGAAFDADAYLLGLVFRPGRAELGLSGGIGAGRAAGDTGARVPLDASLEVPLGPVRLLARGHARADFADDPNELAGAIDELGAAVGLRLGRDTRYWADVVAGAGPYLAATWRRTRGVDFVGAAIGIDLWGGN